MKKIIIVNGIIAGLIVSAMMLISQPMLKKGIIDFDNGMLIGYASMVISLSTIFFGIKTYRDQYEKGNVSFWQACKIGLAIAAIASIFYAITWQFYYNLSASDFMGQYTDYHIEKMKKEGASAAEINTARIDMQQWTKMYKNPFIRFAMTLAEILPVGIVITLISAAILRKRQILPG